MWLSAAKIISFCNFPAQEFECMVCCPILYDKLCVVHWLFSKYRKYYCGNKLWSILLNEVAKWVRHFHRFKNPTRNLFLWCPPRYLGDPVRRNSGIHGILLNTEYTEYSKKRNIQNVLYLIWTGLTKKQRQRILGCFEM